MKNTSIVLLAALSLAGFGCKKKNAGADCDKAIANSLEVSKASLTKMPGVDDKMMAKMRDVGVKNCQDDKWSDEAIKCMTDAKSETEAQGCYGKLTADQQAKMNKAAMDLMPPPPPPAAAGSAAADSPGAAGSAGSSAPAAGSDTAGSAAAPK